MHCHYNTLHILYFFGQTPYYSFAVCSSITTPQEAHNLEVSAAGLLWLKYFRVQCYT